MGKKCILNLEWSSYPSRDRQTATLVSNYLRFHGYEVIEENIFDWISAIKVNEPDLIFISNSTGASINYEITKYAAQKKIPLISFVSEGNFKEEDRFINQFVWGCNDEQLLYENKTLYWSKRSKALAINAYPYIEKNIVVSGAIGFDIYRIKTIIDKDEFLLRYDKERYNKVIGIGCWDFGIFDPKDDRYQTIINEFFPEEKIRRNFLDDRDLFEKILIDIIISFPDILFLLKEHPGADLGYFASAIKGCEVFDNVHI